METKRLCGVQALVFDAYGTLFDVHSVASACDALFPGHGRALSQLWRAKQLEYTWLLSLMDRYADFWQVTERALTYACTVLGLAATPQMRSKLAEAYLRLQPYPEVPPVLAALSRFALVILSNGSPRMLQGLLEHSSLAGRFAHVLSADAARVYKPSPKVYQLAVDCLGIEAAAIAFVSSNPFDVAGAKSFGFCTIWVDRSGAVLDPLGLPPDVTVRQLTDIEAILAP